MTRKYPISRFSPFPKETSPTVPSVRRLWLLSHGIPQAPPGSARRWRRKHGRQYGFASPVRARTLGGLIRSDAADARDLSNLAVDLRNEDHGEDDGTGWGVPEYWPGMCRK